MDVVSGSLRVVSFGHYYLLYPAYFGLCGRFNLDRNRKLSLEFLQTDLVIIYEWCLVWAMNFKASKTKTIIVLRSRSVAPEVLVHCLNDVVHVEFPRLEIFGWSFH